MVDDPGWAGAARPGRRIGHAVEVHERIGSTNDRVRELLREPDGEGIAVLAEEQLAGRGRRGRTWTSPPGRNLMVSVGIRPALAAAEGWQLGMAVALAARTACRTVAPIDLKWPNDLVAEDGSKVGGLLVETAVHGSRLAEAIAGFGINVNWPRSEMPGELREAATSLQELAGGPVDRGSLLGELLEALDGEIAGIEAGRSPLERYRAACRTLGADVEVATPAAVVVGRAVDLDETGSLVVDGEAGRTAISSGEVVRVRPAVPA